MRRKLPLERWPRGSTTVAFRLSDVATRVSHWWLVVRDGEVDPCDVDPGFEADATGDVALRTMTEIWRGDRTWRDCLRSGVVAIGAATSAQRAVPGWLGQFTLAAVLRP